VYFGARVLILDEPTAALGVKQSGVVLKYIARSRDRGLGVVFITHNPHHAFPVGDRFLLLNRGTSLGNYEKADIDLAELTSLMAGGAELDSLAHELEQTLGADSAIVKELEKEATGGARSTESP
jgi:simple sugar transport system ATP-binding protein